MTHKNPNLRGESETSMTPPARSSARPSHKHGKEPESASKSGKDPEVKLDGHKWLVVTIPHWRQCCR
ncbi:hypothetical protein DSO57_1028497 [Entomophthora muscae]|uniref:Uncharacterized protein n=1 Tax=Entomophthora muscae TaxID=34485 RepID=A0ACC2S3I0_9FUNG|nr:hypothetical protein DSO57_1028497 [Entomophthora muscae]